MKLVPDDLRGMVLLGVWVMAATMGVFSNADDLIVSTNTALEAGEYTYGNVVVDANATLTCKGNPTTGEGVTIHATSLTLAGGGRISADGCGYPANQGPGTTSDKGGASYGGRGGGSSAPSYDSALTPTDLGSGSRDVAGGGAICLDISGTLTLDGVVSSSGVNPHCVVAGTSRGGSGGSVYITAGTLMGSGSISARGGSLVGACGYAVYGGGGGRVAVYYSTSTFTGTGEASGGLGNSSLRNGEDGTVGFFEAAESGDMTLYTGPSWRFQANDAGVVNYRDIVLHRSSVTYESGVGVTASGNLHMVASSLAPYYNDLAIVYPLRSTTINCTDLVMTVTEENKQSSILSGNLEVQATNVLLDTNNVISADGCGYPANQGPGTTSGQGGASYGGRGGGSSAPIYGSALTPTDLGSGSRDVAGGGAIRLDISGTLTLDGVVSSSGVNPHCVVAGTSRGGSGGSVYITAGTLMGSGSISARGGSLVGACGYAVYGGGGGRVAVYYSTSTFTGTSEASGGLGNSSLRNGEDGTVVLDTGTVQVQVTPATASWSFTDGAGQLHNGTGSQTVMDVPTGTITLTWGALTNYDAPTAPAPKTLTKDGIVTFSGDYQRQAGTVCMAGIPATAGWSFTDGDGEPHAGAGPQCVNNVPTGSIMVTWSDLANYDAPANPSAQPLIKNGTISFSEAYIRHTGTVQVQVTPALASWSFADGDGATHSGTGSQVLSGMPTGLIVLTWYDLTNYTTPSPNPDSGILVENGTLTLSGEYTRNTGTVEISVTPSSAPWSFLDGDGVEHMGSGNSILNDIPTGQITLTWGQVTGYLLPEENPITKTLGLDETVLFAVEYAQIPSHSADQNGDGVINLTELLRVIQFFNIRGFHCVTPPGSSEDGYLPGAGGDQSCAAHASDYAPHDWQINLTELLRLIQFFNMRGYHACPELSTEDGFCPGP